MSFFQFLHGILAVPIPEDEEEESGAKESGALSLAPLTSGVVGSLVGTLGLGGSKGNKLLGILSLGGGSRSVAGGDDEKHE